MNFNSELEENRHEGEADIRFESLTLVQIIPVELLSEEQRDATYIVESEAEKAVEEVCDDDQAEPAKSTETSLQPLNYKDLKMENGRYKCPYCIRSYSKKYIVPRHIKLFHEQNKVTCTTCGANVRNLAQHQKMQHSHCSSIKCLVCLLILPSKYSHRTHCQEVHGDICTPHTEVKKMTCPVCRIKVKNKRSLWQAHVYYQHMIPQSFFCCPIPNCSGRISKIQDEFNLRKHLSSVHNLIPDQILSCPTCPARVLSPQDLKIHSNQHVDNVFPCLQCQEKFTSFSLLALHLFQAHKCIFRGESEMYVNISSKIDNGILGRNLNSDGINTFTNMDGVKVFSQNCGEEEQFFIIDEDRDDDQNPEEAEGIYAEPEIDPGKVQSINQPFVAEKPSRESYKDDILLYRPIKFATGFPQSRVLNQTLKTELKLINGAQVMKKQADSIYIKLGSNIKNLNEEKSSSALEVNEENKEKRINFEEDKNMNSFKIPSTLKKVELTLHPLEPSDDRKSIRKLEEEKTAQEPENILPTSNKGNFSCPWAGCKKTFVQKCSVNMHIRNVHQARQVQCTECEKVYSNLDNLKTHIQAVHERKSTACPKVGCNKLLSSRRQMQSHLLKHSQTNKSCSIPGCRAVLKNMVTLNGHIRKVHRLKTNQEISKKILNQKDKNSSAVYYPRVDVNTLNEETNLGLDSAKLFENKSPGKQIIVIKKEKSKKPNEATVTTYTWKPKPQEEK